MENHLELSDRSLAEKHMCEPAIRHNFLETLLSNGIGLETPVAHTKFLRGSTRPTLKLRLHFGKIASNAFPSAVAGETGGGGNVSDGGAAAVDDDRRCGGGGREPFSFSCCGFPLARRSLDGVAVAPIVDAAATFHGRSRLDVRVQSLEG